MNKAFIFDMDGVIINSETTWEKYEQKFLSDLLGENIYQKIKGDILGSTVGIIYDKAIKEGLEIDKEIFFQKYDDQALEVYANSQLTQDIDLLIEKLVSLNFKIGLVSASGKKWIGQVLPRLKNKEAFEFVLSLGERTDLKPKPSPDGYLEAIKFLKSTPEKTIILEDSNRGLKAAKSSGALTICLREHLSPTYTPTGADIYIDNLKSLIRVLEVIK